MVEHLLGLPEMAALRDIESVYDTARPRPRVMLYVAVGPEAPTAVAADRLMRDGFTVCVPRLYADRPGHMDIVPIANWSALVPGPFFDIPQPAPDLESVPPHTLDGVIVPAVGFDKQGRRLGQGGGYYDRLFAQLSRRIPRIGWAFSVQIVDVLPEEAHDQRVDVIVTEAGVIRPNGAGRLSQ